MHHAQPSKTTSSACDDASMAHQWRPAGVIHTVDDAGDDVVVMLDARFKCEQQAGQIRYRLLDQTPVKRIDATTFEVDGRTLTVAR